jgi:MFS family permease
MQTFNRKAHPQPGQPTRKGTLAFIFTVVLLDLLGVNLLVPVQAYIVRQYNSDAVTVGLLTVIYSAAQFIAAPVLGLVSDRVGRRPVLLICLLGSAVGYVIFGIGGALWILFLSRLIDGITGGNLSVALAYTADVTPSEKRAQSFALIGAAFGLGFLLGPAIGGALGQIDLALPAYAAAGLTLINLVFGFFVLPESLPREKREAGLQSDAGWNLLTAFRNVIRTPFLAPILVAQFIFLFAFGGMTSNISVFLIEKFRVEPLQFSLVFVIAGVVNIVVQGGLIRALAPRFGEKKLVLAGLVILTTGWLGMVNVSQMWAVYILAGVSGIGSALAMPTLNAMASNRVAQHQQGKLSGVSTSLGSLANVIGPLAAGALYDAVAPGAPYWAAGAVMVAAFILIGRIRAENQPAPQEVPA